MELYHKGRVGVFAFPPLMTSFGENGIVGHFFLGFVPRPFYLTGHHWISILSLPTRLDYASSSFVNLFQVICSLYYVRSSNNGHWNASRYFHNEVQPVFLNSQFNKQLVDRWVLRVRCPWFHSEWSTQHRQFSRTENDIVSEKFENVKKGNSSVNCVNRIREKLDRLQLSCRAVWTLLSHKNKCPYLLAWGRIEFAPECLVSRAFSVKQDLSNWIMLHCADVCLSCFILFSSFRRFSEYASSE